MSGTRLAELAGWPQSKVSRIQNAQQTVTDDDVRAWCSVTDSADELPALLAELRAIRLDQARWRSRLRRGHEPVQDSVRAAEESATQIRSFSPNLVPGLLQTPDYARAVFTTLAAAKGVPDDADAAVAARMKRQAILYDSGKSIEILTTEAALRSPIAPSDVMAAQYDRLLAAIGLTAVRFGIIPLDVQLPLPVVHGYVIRDDTLTVETLSTEIVTRDPDDVRLHGDSLDALWKVAAELADARAILTRLLDG